MKKYIFTLIMLCASTICFAQNDNVVFKGYLYNSDYQVFLNINFYDKYHLDSTTHLRTDARLLRGQT